MCGGLELIPWVCNVCVSCCRVTVTELKEEVRSLILRERHSPAAPKHTHTPGETHTHQVRHTHTR